MASNQETEKNIPRTSPSLARLLRHYSLYALECMSEKEEIMTLAQFYKVNVGYEINRSLIYEKYLRSEKKK